MRAAMALATIGLMYASFILIGWLASRRSARGADDFMVAGRAMPLWLATFTMTATWVDGGYLLGTAEGVYRSSVATGLQGGVCFGISLIIGGLFFARRMRALEYHTLIDPFEARFGARWAVVLALPAVLAEMFWSAELLVALGSTFGVVLDLDLTTGIVVSAAVVTLYTMAGGMWAVAYTDAVSAGAGDCRPWRGVAVRALRGRRRCGRVGRVSRGAARSRGAGAAVDGGQRCGPADRSCRGGTPA